MANTDTIVTGHRKPKEVAMPKQSQSDKNYSGAVSNGHYDLYRGGLWGKHDNVRTYWEDQIRGIKLRPHLRSLVDRTKRSGGKVRVADLGAGTGQGLELLTSWMREEADLRLGQAKVLPPDMIDVYVGADLCKAMVDQGNATYADQGNVMFRHGDFSKGFPLKAEEPFDLYFCSYGSFSHIEDEAMERLLADMVNHAGARALVVGEWLGRHSIEWPCYWDKPASEMLDYSMSWLSPPASSDAPAEHFPMRLWLGDEIQALVRRLAEGTAARLRVLELYDCSTFVGRHVDTAEYNEWIRPTRSAVNRLHESNVRTDLESLKVDVIPMPGHDDLYSYYSTLAFCWNNLVDYCRRRLEGRQSPVRTKNWKAFPAVLQIAMVTLDRVIDTVSWMRMGDPRANIIEPQLGYALRSLELEFQKGTGRGHSLVAIFEIRKS